MPLYLNPKSGRFTSTKVSLGALGDSYYEYLLKMWVMKGRAQEAEMYRVMWVNAMDEMIEKLVFTSSPEKLTYVAEFERYNWHKTPMYVANWHKTLMYVAESERFDYT